MRKNSDHVAKNKLKMALEAEVKFVAVEAKIDEGQLIDPGKDFDPEPLDKDQDEVQAQRLDAIYDDVSLGSDKYLMANNTKMLA